MLEQGLDYVVKLAKSKKQMIDTNPMQYFIRAALAGIYIGFVIVLCFKLGNFFHIADSPATYLAESMFFGIALVLIIYGGAELFTGNTMYFTVATLRKETTISDTLRNWVACYAGNLAGALFFALLFYATGIFGAIDHGHLMNTVVEGKMNTPTMQLFFKAILCNWLVCLACFLPSQVKGDTAKILMIMMLVFTFFLSGYEHSIANLSLFALSLVSPHPDTITFAGAIHNLIPVTIGNIIGGSVFVGMVYHYLTKKAPVAKQEETELVAAQTEEIIPLQAHMKH
ncbi:transporter [Bacillus mycoides]|uniref:Formate/nitrite transporter n=3 Tax=Bacillus cereus group TaxID=86661 RepID=J8A1S3_BACCE|nr:MULTISPECIES: formate/nitrite transporter family protein [Bacillus cereus group]EJQ42531.1 formate/nitrite transporter [Bacillus cereus BAG5X1-1]EJV59756.1 formate/nitrite transporter [Bacillus cereus BAG6O-2]MBJ8005998.1 formate/nitrite transporter family protein [Bacillus cereus]MBJ8069721.1 formate/nitrite transporter family protein [Bacillus cereus]MBJ8189565.1 formate/nitrite transporter family protein [Bacillus cereus]